MNLFILAFDHRVSLEKEGFENIPELKQIIYEGFKKSLSAIQNAAILVDEQYADVILKNAKENGITFGIPVEKAGIPGFEFAYKDFAAHIGKYDPYFAKVVINIKDGVSQSSKNNLKVLSDWCKLHNPKFMLEIVGGEDLNLLLSVIEDFQGLGIKPDFWKLEGRESKEEYEKIVEKIKAPMLILGRGEEREKVEKWLRIGSKIPGIIGFAIGRTIFWEPISDYNNGRIDRETAVEQISSNYIHFYDLFMGH